jgi:rhodanese-related sulfurtransferase
MKQIKLSTTLCLLFLSIALNSACQKKEQTISQISADSLQVMLNKEHGVLLDVRTPEEFAEGHISGAININYNDEKFSAALDTLDKNKPYEVYCRSGKRSGASATMMSEKGFKKVYNLEGGILKWQEKGFETVK